MSLANIVAKYLGKTLNKGPVRVSNWEAILDENQLECKSAGRDGPVVNLTEFDQMLPATRTALCKCMGVFEKSEETKTSMWTS
jgi:hypothetical protein